MKTLDKISISRVADFNHFWVINFLQQSDAVYVHLREYLVKFRRSNRIHLDKTEIEPFLNIFIAEYIRNKRSVHVFVNSCHTCMRCILNQSFSCFPAISVDRLAGEGGGVFHINLYGTCRFSGYHFSA